MLEVGKNLKKKKYLEKLNSLIQNSLKSKQIILLIFMVFRAGGLLYPTVKKVLDIALTILL